PSPAAVADHALHPPWGVPGLPPPSPHDDDARALLREAGVEFPDARVVATPEQALDATFELGYPLVLKATGVMHKSDVGGVVGGIENEAGLLPAWSHMTKRLAPPSLGVHEKIEAHASGRLTVGCQRDPRFGPVLLVGFGGIFTEVLDDVAVALAPGNAEQIAALLLELRGAALLTGARGRLPLAVKAAADAAAKVSNVAAAHPE